jgi:hypothetical protein
VELEIRDDKGELVRRYTSEDKAAPVKDTNNVPAYWIRPPQHLSREAGLHRFLWDLHYPQVPNVEPDYPIAAVYRNTAPVSTAPWVLPGVYSVTLKVDGKTFPQTLTVKLDQRVKISDAELQKQFELSKELYASRLKLEPINEELSSLAAQLDAAKKRGAKTPLDSQIEALSDKLGELAGAENRRPGTQLTLSVMDRVTNLFNRLQEVDAGPTANVVTATEQVLADSRSVVERWKTIEDTDVPALKQQFKLSGLPELTLTGRMIKYHSVSDEDDDDDDPRGEP